MNIPLNIEALRERVAKAASACGRKPESVTPIAVTKTVDASCAAEVLKCGLTNLGENRVQVFLDKYEALGDAPTWHLIGHLQTNKVKYIIGKVSLIHSVDTLHLAEEISKKATAAGICQPILVQFNISGEVSKSGAEAGEAKRMFEALAQLSGISVRGLMTMAPLGAPPLETRRIFAGLRTLADSIAAEHYPNISMQELSMGMSGDFEEAIAEGATLIRVGRALFQ